MAFTIIAITAFQYYWLQKAYEREERGLERQTNMLFAETVGSLQAQKLKLDKAVDTTSTRVVLHSEKTRMRPVDQKMVKMINVMMQKAKDSGRKNFIINDHHDTVRVYNKGFGRRDRLMQFLFDVDSLQDSIKVKELDVAYAKRLKRKTLKFLLPFQGFLPGKRTGPYSMK